MCYRKRDSWIRKEMKVKHILMTTKNKKMDFGSLKIKDLMVIVENNELGERERSNIL